MRFLVKLSLKSIRYRKASLLLSVISISLSVILLLGIERIRTNVHKSFLSSISGTDLIVGARSGNIPLLLSSVFHIGYPNQNVSWHTYEGIGHLPQVDWTIPLSIGDSHKGFPVVATNANMFEHFMYGNKAKLTIKQGKALLEHKGCVLGAEVAKELGYNISDPMIVTHGMGKEEFITHSNEPFIVNGILATTGTPVDRSVFVSLQDMDAIHANFYHTDDHSADVFSTEHIHEAEESTSNHGHHHDHTCVHTANAEVGAESISAFLVGLKNKNEVLGIQRMLNDYEEEPLTAVMPVVTLLDLWQIVKPIEKTLMVISALVLLISLFGILALLLISLNSRTREIAILRALGAKAKQVFMLIVFETLSLTVISIGVGLASLYTILFLAQPIITNKLGMSVQVIGFGYMDFIIILAVFILGGGVGIIPGIQSYKRSLNEGLIVNK